VGVLNAEPSDSLEIDTLAGTDTVDSSGLSAGSIQFSVN